MVFILNSCEFWCESMIVKLPHSCMLNRFKFPLDLCMHMWKQEVCLEAYTAYVYTALERGVEICICSMVFVFIAPCTVCSHTATSMRLLVYELTCLLLSDGPAYFSTRLHLMP